MVTRRPNDPEPSAQDFNRYMPTHVLCGICIAIRMSLAKTHTHANIRIAKVLNQGPMEQLKR